MKDNIREEIERNYLKQEFINDDLLLFIHKPKENKVYVKIRFIENRKINEHYIARLTFKEYLEGNRIRINKNKSAIAVFKKINNQDVLDNLYTLKDHDCVSQDFLDCAHNIYFNNEVDEKHVLIKK